MSRATRADDQIIVGGEPRVNLLPPEVGLLRKFRALRRNLIISFGVVLLLVGAGIGTASWLATRSESELVAAQLHSTELLLEQGKYVEVRQVQKEMDAAVAARQVGASTEIDWKTYLLAVGGVLPPDVTIESVEVTSATPLAPSEIPTIPLQPERVATLKLSLLSPALPSVPDWLDGMKTLPGYADGTPGLIEQVGGGSYKVELTMHINKSAFTNRFAASEGK